MSKTKAIRDHYGPRISDGRRNHEVLDWSDAAAQQARFAALVDNVPLAGKSILDVGCGLGDLLAYLAGRDIDCRYTGADIVPEMIAAARQRHPEARFVCLDIFAEDALAPGAFDVVFCSGTFNLDLGNSAEFLPCALHRLLTLARRYLVFNLLHVRTGRKHKQCAYHDPADVLAMLEPLGCESRLIDDYLPNDFTVICTK